MKRLAPQRRLVGEHAEARIRAARLRTTSGGFAEQVEALYLIAAGAGSVVVHAEGARQAVLFFDPSSDVELALDVGAPRDPKGTLDPGFAFESRSAREFAEGAVAALRELYALARDDDPGLRG